MQQQEKNNKFSKEKEKFKDYQLMTADPAWIELFDKSFRNPGGQVSSIDWR